MAYDEERHYEVIEDKPMNREQRQAIWDMASGLQLADGLEVTEVAKNAASKYISGSSTATEARRAVERHYQEDQRKSEESEADLVSMRITQMLDSDNLGTKFDFSPKGLATLHYLLFKDVLPNEWVGRWRNENISKIEPILGGRTVLYGNCSEIQALLDFDFEGERNHTFNKPLKPDDARHVADFSAGIWQTHPFREGNTRTVAVFSQMYLRRLGFEVSNEVFRENGLLFRDAMVRASFMDIDLHVNPNRSFIEEFYECVCFGRKIDVSRFDMNLHGIRNRPVDEEPYRTLDDYR